MKAIIFDSGILINFTLNGLLPELKELKKIFNGKFLITREVRQEVIDKPMGIKRFKLEALKIKELLSEGVFELPSSIGINEDKITSMTNEIKNIANNTFYGNNNAIHIIDSGEASCLALSTLLDKQNIENVIAVDERTIRILGERPENLDALLQKKLHTKIVAKRNNFKSFNGFKFIRSTELIYIAYKKGLVRLKDHDVLDALLYAMKFNGCSVSDEEISEIKNLK